MPNLTSYHPPVIHLNRELPKTYCDLIQHEFEYNHFLRTRIANVQSSLVFTNKKNSNIYSNNIRRKRNLSNDLYQKNFELCKRILQIWNGKRKISIDCHNENYKKQRNISHFRLRQKQWKEKIDNENKKLISSLIYHRNKYQPIHNQYISYKNHLKLLETMSQKNFICKNLFKSK